MNGAPLLPAINALVQIPEDACGSTPNVAIAEWNGVDGEHEPIPVAAFALVILRYHQESKGYLERFVDLIPVQTKRKARPHAGSGRMRTRILTRTNDVRSSCDRSRSRCTKSSVRTAHAFTLRHSGGLAGPNFALPFIEIEQW